MQKEALRKVYKQKRNQLTEEAVDTQSIEIANQLLKLPIWEKTIIIYF